MQAREMRGRPRHVFFKWLMGWVGRKIGSLKRATSSKEKWTIACRCGAKRISSQHAQSIPCSRPLFQVAMAKSFTPLYLEAHLQVKPHKTHRFEPPKEVQCRTWHAYVARSTCASQKGQSTPGEDYFWKLRCRKIFSTQNLTKNLCSGALLEVSMSQKRPTEEIERLILT